jgi:hypothetical protein
MALQTISPFFWTMQGQVQADLVYDDVSLDVRAVVMTNTSGQPVEFIVDDSRGHVQDVVAPTGLTAQSFSVPPNRYLFVRDADGNLQPTFRAQFIGPAPATRKG